MGIKTNVKIGDVSAATVNTAREKLFSCDEYKQGVKLISDLTPDLLRELANQICEIAGGGLSSQCAFDSILVVAALCIGRGNVVIHENYIKSISLLKVISAPVSSLKTPLFSFIRKIVNRLDKILTGAQRSILKHNLISLHAKTSKEYQARLKAFEPIHSILDPGSLEGLEINLQTNFQHVGVLLGDEFVTVLKNLAKTTKQKIYARS